MASGPGPMGTGAYCVGQWKWSAQSNDWYWEGNCAPNWIGNPYNGYQQVPKPATSPTGAPLASGWTPTKHQQRPPQYGGSGGSGGSAGQGSGGTPTNPYSNPYGGSGGMTATPPPPPVLQPPSQGQQAPPPSTPASGGPSGGQQGTGLGTQLTFGPGSPYRTGDQLSNDAPRLTNEPEERAIWTPPKAISDPTGDNYIPPNNRPPIAWRSLADSGDIPTGHSRHDVTHGSGTLHSFGSIEVAFQRAIEEFASEEQQLSASLFETSAPNALSAHAKSPRKRSEWRPYHMSVTRLVFRVIDSRKGKPVSGKTSKYRRGTLAGEVPNPDIDSRCYECGLFEARELLLKINVLTTWWCKLKVYETWEEWGKKSPKWNRLATALDLVRMFATLESPTTWVELMTGKPGKAIALLQSPVDERDFWQERFVRSLNDSMQTAQWTANWTNWADTSIFDCRPVLEEAWGQIGAEGQPLALHTRCPLSQNAPWGAVGETAPVKLDPEPSWIYSERDEQEIGRSDNVVPSFHLASNRNFLEDVPDDVQKLTNRNFFPGVIPDAGPGVVYELVNRSWALADQQKLPCFENQKLGFVWDAKKDVWGQDTSEGEYREVSGYHSNAIDERGWVDLDEGG